MSRRLRDENRKGSTGVEISDERREEANPTEAQTNPAKRDEVTRILSRVPLGQISQAPMRGFGKSFYALAY